MARRPRIISLGVNKNGTPRKIRPQVISFQGLKQAQECPNACPRALRTWDRRQRSAGHVRLAFLRRLLCSRGWNILSPTEMWRGFLEFRQGKYQEELISALGDKTRCVTLRRGDNRVIDPGRGVDGETQASTWLRDSERASLVREVSG
jgi:hypothetical protein